MSGVVRDESRSSPLILITPMPDENNTESGHSHQAKNFSDQLPKKNAQKADVSIKRRVTKPASSQCSAAKRAKIKPKSAKETMKEESESNENDKSSLIGNESVIVLKGILWKEMMAGVNTPSSEKEKTGEALEKPIEQGILVLNVCWRDRIYGGTLLDLNHFGWASPESFRLVANQLENGTSLQAGTKDARRNKSSTNNSKDDVVKQKDCLSHTAVRLHLPRANECPLTDERSRGDSIGRNVSENMCHRQHVAEKDSTVSDGYVPERNTSNIPYCPNCNSYTTQYRYSPQTQNHGMPSEVRGNQMKRATLDDLAAAAMSLEGLGDWQPSVQEPKSTSDAERISSSNTESCFVAADECAVRNQAERGVLNVRTGSSPAGVTPSAHMGAYPIQFGSAPLQQHITSATYFGDHVPNATGAVFNNNYSWHTGNKSNNFLVDNLTKECSRPQSVMGVDMSTTMPSIGSILPPTVNFSGAYPTTSASLMAQNLTNSQHSAQTTSDFNAYLRQVLPTNYSMRSASDIQLLNSMERARVNEFPRLLGTYQPNNGYRSPYLPVMRPQFGLNEYCQGAYR